MINHINWHSVEQDGWPTKKGVYLIVRPTNELEDRLCIDYLYSTDPPEWSRCTLEEITHYIPIEDIPMPKANNGGMEIWVEGNVDATNIVAKGHTQISAEKINTQNIMQGNGTLIRGEIDIIQPSSNPQNTNTAS